MSEGYRVPAGVEIATAWAWRILVLGAAGFAAFWLLAYFSEITVPLAIALLGAALTIGAVDRLERAGLPRLLATLLVTLAMLGGLVGLLFLVGQQLATQFDELRAKVVTGVGEVENWLQTGPLGLSDTQIADYSERLQDAIRSTGGGGVIDQLTAVGLSLTHFVAGFFIALFAVIFFLYEGNRIWAWVVMLFPREARAKVNSSGHQAWVSLTSFVRATVVVAGIDAIGIGLGALILGLPVAPAIAVIVFIGAFVPVLGAFLSGMVAVLVALVAQGPIAALIMLLIVIGVQQIESHVLQPFVMGRLVSVHPLAIILAIAAGVIVAGVAGALFAVPLVAALNGIVRHLAEESGVPMTRDGLPEHLPDDAQPSSS